jgi:hypothetical protein
MPCKSLAADEAVVMAEALVAEETPGVRLKMPKRMV